MAPNGCRSEYGQQVLERLAADIEMRVRLLYMDYTRASIERACG